LDDSTAPEVLINRPSDSHGIDAVMRVEASVLGGDDGLTQGIGHLCERYEDATFDVKLGEELVVVVVDLAALAGVELFEGGNRWQCSRQHGVGPKRGGASADEPDEEHDETGRQDEATPSTARSSRS